MFINPSILVAVLSIVSAAPAFAAPAGSGSSLPSIRRSLASKLERRAEKLARQNANGDPQKSLTLEASQVAPGLAQDGQAGGGDPGQVASLTSTNNYINFCLTQNVPLTNGQQVKGGSCNAVPMGRIAGVNNMPSCKFVFPKNGDTIPANKAFTITMAIKNLVTGNFVNPNTNYYSAPQQVDGSGNVIGHSHVTVEQLTSLDQTTTTDATKFVFFKGLNNKAVNGQLTADVTNGLAAGAYRMCSINSAANHQPALVAVAQRGSVDDCSYFTVSNNAGAGGNAGNGGAGAGTGTGNTGTGNLGSGNNGNAGGASTTAAASTSVAATSAAATTTAAAGNNGGGRNGNGGGRNGNGGGRGGFGGGNGGGRNGNGAVAVSTSASVPVSSAAPASNSSSAPAATPTTGGGAGSGNATGGNFQTFTGSLGGAAPAVTTGVRGFDVNGNGFVNKAAALQRSCDIQKNSCANAANSSGNKAPLTVSACEAQQQACTKAISA